jgi:hypothetical protein
MRGSGGMAINVLVTAQLSIANGSDWRRAQPAETLPASGHAETSPLSQSIVQGTAIGDIAVMRRGLFPYLFYATHVTAMGVLPGGDADLRRHSRLTLAAVALSLREHCPPDRRLLRDIAHCNGGLLLAFAFFAKVPDDYSRVWAFAWFAATLFMSRRTEASLRSASAPRDQVSSDATFASSILPTAQPVERLKRQRSVEPDRQRI